MSLKNAVSMDHLAFQDNSKKLTFLQKIRFMATHITVEPLIFFYILPGTMGLLATQNMNLEKACRVNLKYNTSVCDAMFTRDTTGYEDYQEAEVQKLVAKMLTIKTAIIGFFPTCLLLFFGSWSDRHSRRKPVILIPILGDIISYMLLFFCAYFFLELSIEYSTLADAVPFSLGGGPPCIALGVYSYVSGISSDEDRTIRIGAVSMFQNIAIAIGNAIGGVLIEPLGYKGVYIASSVIMISVFIYGVAAIRDTSRVEGAETEKGFLLDFFDLNHIKNTFKICFKEGEGNRKKKMIIMLFLSVMIMGPFYGELAVLYLYTRIKFGWNEVNFSIFNTLQFVIQISGSIFALSFFSKYLKLNDAILGIIAMISKIAACLIYAFAPTGYYFFIGVFIEIFHGTSHIAMRSIISKIVPPHELGQSSSVFGVCEAMMPLAFGPFYTTVYNYTIRSFPGTFYLISAGLYIITSSLFYWLYKAGNEEKTSVEDEEKEKQEENLLKKTRIN